MGSPWPSILDRSILIAPGVGRFQLDMQRRSTLRFHGDFEGSMWVLGSKPKSTLLKAEIRPSIFTSAPYSRSKGLDLTVCAL